VKCLRRDCEFAALKGGNLCHVHAPTPPEGRLVREGFVQGATPPLAIELAIVLGVGLAAIVIYWAVPKLVDLTHPGVRASVHARALASCRMPTEHEQLHIVVRERDGGLISECMYVGSRGTYGRRP
jgi:hypothetical protein